MSSWTIIYLVVYFWVIYFESYMLFFHRFFFSALFVDIVYSSIENICYSMFPWPIVYPAGGLGNYKNSFENQIWNFMIFKTFWQVCNWRKNNLTVMEPFFPPQIHKFLSFVKNNKHLWNCEFTNNTFCKIKHIKCI